jgi:MFS transporter, NNP family, nitrate/nitrite transporter
MPKQKTKNYNGKYKALILATSALVVNFWAWSLLSPLGTKYASELSLDPTQLSLLLAVPVIIGSLGRIVLGMLTDKIGGRAAFVVISLLTAIPVFGLSMIDTYNHLLLVAILLGTGGASFVIGVPFISAWFPPERRGLMLGIYSMGNAGTALSGFLTPRLADSIGRDQTFMLVGALLILMAILFITIGKNAPDWKPSTGSLFTKLKKAVSFRATRDLSIVYAITFGAFVAFGVYLPVLLKVAYDLPLTDAASRAAGFILLATVARPLGGLLSDKIGGRMVIKVSLVAIAILASIVAFQPTLALQTTVAYLALAFVLGCANGAVFALVGKLSRPEVMGSVTGIVGAAGGLGGFFPPLVLGVTYQQTHSYTAALFMLAVCACAVLVYINSRFKDRKLYQSA